MILRPAGENDADELYQLDASHTFSARWSFTGWHQELQAPGAHVWCAEEGGNLVGFTAVHGAAGMYEVTNMAVAAAQQRRGVATALLTTALQALGTGRVTLEVSAHNASAISLYQKHGFTSCGVRKQFYADGADALVLGKDL